MTVPFEIARFDEKFDEVLDFSFMIDVLVVILLIVSYYRSKILCIQVIVYLHQLKLFLVMAKRPFFVQMNAIGGICFFFIKAVAITLVNDSWKFTQVFIQVLIFSSIRIMLNDKLTLMTKFYCLASYVVVLTWTIFIFYAIFALIHQKYIQLLIRTMN